VLRRLTQAPWPGNVRQLRNEVIRLAACARGSIIEFEDLFEGAPPAPEPAPPAPAKAKPLSLKKAIEDLERRMILEALTSTRNNQQQAAKMLGLSRQGLINKLKRYSL
jgi:DNA-binding NtrC family response regulator